MFSAASYKSIYNRFMGPLSQQVGVKLNNGTDFDPAIMVAAHVSAWRESDLVPDSPVRLGDLRVVILYEDLPPGIRLLEKKDRIEIDGRNYGVIHWDVHTRSVGDTPIAVEAAVRG